MSENTQNTILKNAAGSIALSFLGNWMTSRQNFIVFGPHNAQQDSPVQAILTTLRNGSPDMPAILADITAEQTLRNMNIRPVSTNENPDNQIILKMSAENLIDGLTRVQNMIRQASPTMNLSALNLAGAVFVKNTTYKDKSAMQIEILVTDDKFDRTRISAAIQTGSIGTLGRFIKHMIQILPEQASQEMKKSA